MCSAAVLFADVTPSAVHVGNIVQGARLAWAQGRDIGGADDEADSARKVGLRCHNNCTRGSLKVNWVKTRIL